MPTDLLPYIPHLLSDLPPTEWKASLGTKDLEEAKRLLRRRLVEIDRQIATARAKVSNTASAPLTVENAQHIAENELAVWMGEDAFWRLENGEAAYDTAAEILEKAAPRIRRAYAVGDWRDALVEAEDALERAGRWFPSGDPSTTLLAQELLKARARFVELLEKRQRGEVAEVPSLPPLDPEFPWRQTIGSRIGGKADQIAAVRDWVRSRSEFADVAALLPEDADDRHHGRAQRGQDGSVYLIQSGPHFKIGRSDELERRVKEIRIALPDAAVLVHSITTDDPSGIEAYWHRRFADRRANGEWFKLTAADVLAFKRRRFQ